MTPPRRQRRTPAPAPEPPPPEPAEGGREKNPERL
ncbi:DUF742 domain-containing protein, partial [Streptomyces sp. SID5998]|nr:DUF742 domain-containing protein [Streptomyces sp. SID5998]